jgi:hypothetical protein
MTKTSHYRSKNISRRQMLATGLAASLLPSAAVAASDIIAHAQAPRFLGRDDAPIQVIEFFSMTCSHCASFHKNTFPQIKTRLIDQGAVRFEMRAFPLDGLALRAHAMARTATAEKYFPMVAMLLEKQNLWAGAEDPIGALRKLGWLASAALNLTLSCATGHFLKALWRCARKRCASGRFRQHHLSSSTIKPLFQAACPLTNLPKKLTLPAPDPGFLGELIL